jgi:hypothetical protein
LLRPLEGLSLDDQDYIYFISHCVTNDIKGASAYLKDGALSATFLHKRDEEGDTVLSLVCMEGHQDMTLVLVKHGSPLDIYNGQGETPLIIALQHGCIEIASYLVSCGASIRSRDAQGSGVLSHAKDLRDRLEQRRQSICVPLSVESNALLIKHVLRDIKEILASNIEDMTSQMSFTVGHYFLTSTTSESMLRCPRYQALVRRPLPLLIAGRHSICELSPSSEKAYLSAQAKVHDLLVCMVQQCR